MASHDIAIKVKNIHKMFKIPLETGKNLKQRIVNFSTHRKGYREFTPLNGVSFEVKKGEFFGIVGRNGSGKSTLLKTIAGIYSPEKGYVKVNGTLVPFIELGVGFNPELTGRENVYLNGALLGFSRREMDNMYDEIVDFAELHNFMDERLKNYSSGMQVRLAFSIAIRAKGDILLLDEVLAVGDSAFQQKCYDYFEQLKSEHRTIILVTHSMGSVNRFCDRALLLEDGHIKLIGSPQDVADQYLLDNIKKKPETSKKETEKSNFIRMFDAYINGNEFDNTQTLKITAEYSLRNKFDVLLGMSILRDGKSFAELNSYDTILRSDVNAKHKATVEVPLDMFNPGQYQVDVVIFEKKNKKILDRKVRAGQFVVTGYDQTRGAAMHVASLWKQS